MTTMGDLTDEVLSTLQGFGMSMAGAVWLSDSIDSSALELPVEGSSDVLGEGVVELGDELVYVRTWDATSQNIQAAPDGRGWSSTDATAHDAGTRVRVNPPFTRQAVRQAINHAIDRSYPRLFGHGTVTQEFRPAHYTYEVPSETEQVISLTGETIGPSHDWLDVYHFDFDPNAETDAYPSGKTVTLGYPLHPGKRFKVVFRKRPSRLETPDADLTSSGLAESARMALIYGACSHLVTLMDAPRAALNSAAADNNDDWNKFGTSTQIGATLEARFQQELLSEQARLRKTFPSRPRIVRR